MHHILSKLQISRIYNRYIRRSGSNTFFLVKLSTGIDPANNFGLTKMYNKKYIYLKYIGKTE